jgi:hypothetical protein
MGWMRVIQVCRLIRQAGLMLSVWGVWKINSPIRQIANSPVYYSPNRQFANSPVLYSPNRQFASSPIHQFASLILACSPTLW